MQRYFKMFLPLIILVGSCKEEKNKIIHTETEITQVREDELKVSNRKTSLFISQKQNAIVGWDTTDLFTYQLQELFDTKPISFTGKINDIIKHDSIFVLHVYSSTKRTWVKYIAEISVSFNKFEELKFRLKSKNERKEGCFIFKVTDVQSVYPKITSNVETSGSDVESAESYLALRYSESLIKFKGELIDYFMFKAVDDED